MSFQVRPIHPDDFFWIKDCDCTPLNIERDSIYLFFCVHFENTSFVAEDAAAKSPLGFLLGFLPAGCKTAYVHYLFVEEAHRRRGIGRALMEPFLRACRRLGADAATLYTIRAVEFYRKLGFDLENKRFAPRLASYIQEVKGASIMTMQLR